MHRTIVGFATALAITVSTLPAARAADENGSYSIRGAGTVSCQTYVSSTPAQKQYAQTWWAGYVTAMNRVTPKTFHLLGDASPAAADKWLLNYCQQNPTARFETAVNAMLKAAYPSRTQKAP